MQLLLKPRHRHPQIKWNTKIDDNKTFTGQKMVIQSFKKSQIWICFKRFRFISPPLEDGPAFRGGFFFSSLTSASRLCLFRGLWLAERRRRHGSISENPFTNKNTISGFDRNKINLQPLEHPSRKYATTLQTILCRHCEYVCKEHRECVWNWVVTF